MREIKVHKTFSYSSLLQYKPSNCVVDLHDMHMANRICWNSKTSRPSIWIRIQGIDG